MAPPADLAQIGKEGFDLIDRLYGRKSSQDSHEELENHFKHHPQPPVHCTYHKPQNPTVTERLPISQPHYVIFRANDVPMTSQPLHENYPNGILNPNLNTYSHEMRQPIAFQDFGQVHPGHGMVQENGVMDSTRSAKLCRGVAMVEVRLVKKLV